jgi:hypothetical protein
MHEEDRTPLVDLGIWGENQRDKMTVQRRATVQWPSRQEASA